MSAMRREREHQGVFKAERRLGGRVGVQRVWEKPARRRPNKLGLMTLGRVCPHRLHSGHCRERLTQRVTMMDVRWRSRGGRRWARLPRGVAHRHLWKHKFTRSSTISRMLEEIFAGNSIFINLLFIYLFVAVTATLCAGRLLLRCREFLLFFFYYFEV